MENLLSAVYGLEPAEKIRELVKLIPVEDLWTPSEHGLDIMHHAILAGNIGCMSLLMELPPADMLESLVSPKPRGYLHLGCLFGLERAVAVICEGSDVDVSARCEAVSWPAFDAVRSCLRRSTCHIEDAQLEIADRVIQEVLSRRPDESPVYAPDVAAMAGHFDCVVTVLKSARVQYTSRRSTLLERALDLGFLHAFRMLLTRDPETDVVKSALKMALGRKLPDFVDALLDHGVNVTEALDGVNPYHYVYLCSPSFNRRPATGVVSQHACGIDLLTGLLIKRNFDINVRNPPGTFPLYSLLASLIQEKDYNPASVPVRHIQALQMLLRANARTDVDELTDANSTPISLSLLSVQAGRELATSALNAYFLGLQASDTWRPHIAEHLDRICLTLLENGADAAGVAGAQSTPFHDLMRATATQHAMGHMHADLSTMARMLLYFGANPNSVNAAGQFPIESYFSLLLNSMGGLIAFRRWKATDNAAQVLHALYFMDTSYACTVRERIIQYLHGARADGMPDDVVEFVTLMMDGYVCVPKSLQELAKLALWKAVQRRMTALRSIHMPRLFLSGISDLFNLDILQFYE